MSSFKRSKRPNQGSGGFKRGKPDGRKRFESKSGGSSKSAHLAYKKKYENQGKRRFTSPSPSLGLSQDQYKTLDAKLDEIIKLLKNS